jgi:hypothetical protein
MSSKIRIFKKFSPVKIWTTNPEVMVVGSVVEILFTLGNNYKKGAILLAKSF